MRPSTRFIQQVPCEKGKRGDPGFPKHAKVKKQPEAAQLTFGSPRFRLRGCALVLGRITQISLTLLKKTLTGAEASHHIACGP